MIEGLRLAAASSDSVRKLLDIIYAVVDVDAFENDNAIERNIPAEILRAAQIAAAFVKTDSSTEAV